MTKKISEETPLTTTRSTIAYYGSVEIQLVKGDRAYKTIKQHNLGTPELFRYIANSLAGSVNNSLMPRYIHIFFNENAKNVVPGNELWGDNYSKCSMNIPFANVEVRYNAQVNGGGYETRYTFMLPYNQVFSGPTNVVCLYNNVKFGDGRVPLAYIILDKDAEKEIDEWLYIDDNNTANIIVTWTMTVCNGEIIE